MRILSSPLILVFLTVAFIPVVILQSSGTQGGVGSGPGLIGGGYGSVQSDPGILVPSPPQSRPANRIIYDRTLANNTPQQYRNDNFRMPAKVINMSSIL